ncbi:DUF3108 domain-containing protein [Rhodocytophaga rosea]|uniref:DUF3108 domain-containing protein n=1 Tax=Rhodocytophaga rosea TaxID=2704465 RepID=A0A6C0GFR4_9BACT|nr:DUF3108 domain-containing protein [Rhodocytophaga rosea]QHT66592.1 DUF3108 domain-containing protein [Rhodocytophaga rosea]
MRKLFIYVILVVLACGFIMKDSYRRVINESFTAGEVLEYRLHYGFLNIGESVIEVSPTLYRINERICYKVNVSGRTSGTFEVGYKVRDTWRSYIDTSALIPQRFYTNIQENKYRKEEWVFFDHIRKTVRSEEKNQETKEFTIPSNVQDLVSGYYYLRTLDFNKYREGDTIAVSAFFDDEFYNFKVKFRGRGEVKTKFGKIKCLKITPIMPDNQLFKDENAIRIWISDDENKIPIKVESEFSFLPGVIEVELKRHKGLKNDIHFY